MRRAALCQSFSGGGSGLLDIYPDASVAFSLRNLKDSQSGNPVIRIRRASDNTEQDFIAEEIIDGTLATFCSGTDGLVATWYDQSDNSNNLVQPSAVNQPKIVTNGVVSLLGTKPEIPFDKTLQQFFSSTTNLGGTDTLSLYASAQGGLYGQDSITGSETGGGYAYYLGSTKMSTWKEYITTYSAPNNMYPRTARVITSNICTPSKLEWTGNDTTFSQASVGNFTNLLGYVARTKANVYHSIRIQELIIYKNIDQTPNDSGIRTNMNDYYLAY